MRRFVVLIVAGIFLLLPHTLSAQQGATWVVSWVASAHGPYPVGNPSAQPDQRFAFPSPQTGANDQTFRLIVRPHISGRGARSGAMASNSVSCAIRPSLPDASLPSASTLRARAAR